MGIKSLFSKKKKEEPKTVVLGRNLTEEEKRNRVAIQYFNFVMKNKTPIPFRFEGFSFDKKKLYYKSQYEGGVIEVEILKNYTRKDVVHLIEDLLREIDYILNEFSRFYQVEVQLKKCHVDFENYKEVEVMVNNDKKVLRYHSTLSHVVKEVKSYLATQMTVLEGELGGRGTDFYINAYDLIAFLKKNKGKRIRIEVLKEKKEEPKEELVVEDKNIEVEEEKGDNLMSLSPDEEIEHDLNIVQSEQENMEESEIALIENIEQIDPQEVEETNIEEEYMEEKNTQHEYNQEVFEDNQEEKTNE